MVKKDMKYSSLRYPQFSILFNLYDVEYYSIFCYLAINPTLFF